MKILQLKLFSNKLSELRDFYIDGLNMELLSSSVNSFSIKVGWSELVFEMSKDEHLYHYCFLIPSNKLKGAKSWIEQRCSCIELENGNATHYFENWNAESLYFYDGSGNIAEFIVRYDLNNSSELDFSQNDILCVNEIGMPTTTVASAIDDLHELANIEFWKGDLNRFGTVGSQEGLFLLPNYKIKETWFPTELKIQPEPFSAIIENKGQKYEVTYLKEEISVEKIT